MIARFIQEERGELVNLKRRSLEQALRRYVNDASMKDVLTPDPVQARAIDLSGNPPEYIQKLREKAKEHLDALTEMETLYLIQFSRLTDMVQVEREQQNSDRKPSFLSTLRAEIKDCFNMAKDIASLQMDLGILDREPARADIRLASVERREIDLGDKVIALLGQHPAFQEMLELVQDPEQLKRLARQELLLETNSVQTEDDIA